jgi:hypothetical protein
MHNLIASAMSFIGFHEKRSSVLYNRRAFVEHLISHMQDKQAASIAKGELASLTDDELHLMAQDELVYEDRPVTSIEPASERAPANSGEIPEEVQTHSVLDRK